MSRGPLPEHVTTDLEAIKRTLASMSADDLSPDLTDAIALEISAIRLQLKRLAADQAQLHAELERRALDA